VGVTGLHWHGQHLLPRNAQIAELAGFTVCAWRASVDPIPVMVPDHVCVFQVRTGASPR